MTSLEFRSEGKYYSDHTKDDEHQLVLPINLGINREVHWLHGERSTRWGWFGRKAVTNLVMREDLYFPKTTFINASSIAELNDPNLRYALRFADAADAVGWTHTSPGSMSAHNVSVTATDEGVKSKFLDASYTGVGAAENDTFMQNLHNAHPK